MSYAILNPLNGSYTKVETIEERNNVLSEISWKFFLLHTHDSPVSKINLNDDNTETWFSQDISDFSIESYRNKIEEFYLNKDSFKEKDVFLYQANCDIIKGMVDLIENDSEIEEKEKNALSAFIKTFKGSEIPIPVEVKEQGIESILIYIKSEYARIYKENLNEI